MKAADLKRWAPLVGSAVLALSLILRMLGVEVGGLEFLSAALGVPEDFVADLAKLPAALAALIGVGLKFRSMYKEARDADDYVRKQP